MNREITFPIILFTLVSPLSNDTEKLPIKYSEVMYLLNYIVEARLQAIKKGFYTAAVH